MKIVYKIILCFLLIVTACFQSFAQSGQLQFNHVDIKDGLSHNQVNCILKDDQGFMWFGTPSGLNRYDGYSFKVFRHKLQDSSSLKDSYILGIFNLPDGKIWVNTRVGCNVYDPVKETFTGEANKYLKSISLPPGTINSIVKGPKNFFWFLYENKGIYGYFSDSIPPVHIHYLPNNATSIANNQISDMAVDHFENLWIVQKNGILQKLDVNTLKVVYRNDSLLEMNNGGSEPYKIFIDNQGDLWIYSVGQSNGLFYFDSDSKSFQHITTESEPFQINNNIVYAVIQDENGDIWVGTDHGGINVIDKKSGTIRFLKHNPEDSKSLSQNSIYALYKDGSGIIWVGTYKRGVCYYNESFARFALYSHNPNQPEGKSLPYEDVNCFVEDKKGNLWIGTNGGGLVYFDRKKNTFKQYKHSADNSNSLCNNVIVSLCMDSLGKLWIGTYMGGLDCYDGKTFTHYKHDPNDSTSLSNNSIWDIFEDAEGRLWIGTLGGGLERFNKDTKSFISYKNEIHIEGISYVMVITQNKNKLWLGTSIGVEVLDLKTEQTSFYQHDVNDSTSLSNDNINSIFKDSRGWMWVGTREGLNLFNPKTKSFRTFSIQDGLPSNTILTILEDGNHRLWISTPGGLSCLTITEGLHKNNFSFKNYNESDGLQGREFNMMAAYKTREGELIFGGPNGFNLFNPDKIDIDQSMPALVFTDLRIFNKRVSIGDTIYNHVILPRSISKIKSIIIPYRANDFSLSFAALGYTHSGEKKYAYKLEGFNDKWILSGDNAHTVTYTNLDPGEYTFLVKASNNDGLWSQDPAMLQIEILPPFWLTIWAYIIYAILILGALYAARSILLYRTRMNFRIEHEQHEARRMHELDMMKIRFFTNISHEFRTPLTLILSPLERMLKQNNEDGGKSQLKLVHRNAKRLLHLVNQLLDFRKMEVQEIKLHPLHREIIAFITDSVNSFADIAEKKNINFTLNTSIKYLTTDFDPDKLERILFNLLSNAFKFTHEKGTISVEVSLTNEAATGNVNLMIRVKDNGIGIPIEKQQRIFERFFQHGLPSSVVNTGSGIGLSITHEFVRLHRGTIQVESEPDKGSCFTVLLPITSEKNHFETEKPQSISLIREQSESIAAKKHKNKPTILLIDDNEDFRFYLKDNLSVYFNLVEASNGKEGWEKCLEIKPKLIVSDVMMPARPAGEPEMTGIDLSKKLKKDSRTSDIPLILLTARASDEQRLEGFETGANDYITKPFNFEILLARILNLLAEKKRQLKNAEPKVPINPKEINIKPEDGKFLQEVQEVVEKNMQNPDFSVEDLSASLYMSRVTLYKKLSAITGKTPVAYIRLMRIKRASQLLEKGQMKVAQVAYEVGFNNPKYFTKYFKQEFGVLPSEYGRDKE